MVHHEPLTKVVHPRSHPFSQSIKSNVHKVGVGKVEGTRETYDKLTPTQWTNL